MRSREEIEARLKEMPGYLYEEILEVLLDIRDLLETVPPNK